jgi:hypothetical protein
MPRSQIYVVAAPIGDHLTDFAVAGLRAIEKTTTCSSSPTTSSRFGSERRR